MGFAKLILPDENNSNRYRNNNYYKNIGSIGRLVNYTLANGKTYIKGKEAKPKVRYCDAKGNAN